MLPNGGKIESATMSDYLMHFLTFGLKVLFSSCPPPGMMQGWPSFAVSLIYIGFMAALIRFTMHFEGNRFCYLPSKFLKVVFVTSFSLVTLLKYLVVCLV